MAAETESCDRFPRRWTPGGRPCGARLKLQNRKDTLADAIRTCKHQEYPAEIRRYPDFMSHPCGDSWSRGQREIPAGTLDVPSNALALSSQTLPSERKPLSWMPLDDLRRRKTPCSMHRTLSGAGASLRGLPISCKTGNSSRLLIACGPFREGKQVADASRPITNDSRASAKIALMSEAYAYSPTAREYRLDGFPDCPTGH
jgi:hypothetical protein